MPCLIPSDPNTCRHWQSMPLTIGLFVSESVFVAFLYAKKARHVPKKLTKKAKDFLSKHVHIHKHVPKPKSLLSSSKHLMSTIKSKATKIPFMSKKKGVPAAASTADSPAPASPAATANIMALTTTPSTVAATNSGIYNLYNNFNTCDTIRSISDFETEEFLESESDEDEENESREGGYGLWQKGILMGERCAPPRFSGVIFYDIHGNQMEEPPQKIISAELLDMIQREDHAGLWQKGILMGEKCTPPRFSGVIFYDIHGNRFNEPPPSLVPTSSRTSRRFQRFKFPTVKEEM